MITIGDAIEDTCRQLEASDVFYGHGTDNPWDEAVQLVLAACSLPADSDRSVIEQPVGEAESGQIERWLRERISKHVPLPYLTGKAWFAGIEFLSDARALVPRSPLAAVIQSAYAPWYAGPEPRRLLDLCAGGGSIGIAAALHDPQLEVVLTDLDSAALTLARENIDKHHLGGRVITVESDLFAALEGQRFDIILSNPPYVDAQDLADMPMEYHHEPPQGLGSGADGLDITRKILSSASEYLQPWGLLVVEVGNSWEALEAAYPSVPFTWLEFSEGGHGVFALDAQTLQDSTASLS